MKKISLIISLTGILILLLIINSTELETTKISSINDNFLNKNIKIIGQITNIKNYDNFATLTIKDSTGQIQGICNCNLNQTDKTFEITGRVSTYNNQLQINIDKINAT
jgi:RecJ-like exonuclease